MAPNGIAIGSVSDWGEPHGLLAKFTDHIHMFVYSALCFSNVSYINLRFYGLSLLPCLVVYFPKIILHYVLSCKYVAYIYIVSREQNAAIIVKREKCGVL